MNFSHLLDPSEGLEQIKEKKEDIKEDQKTL
jgi:hypothetical protein